MIFSGKYAESQTLNFRHRTFGNVDSIMTESQFVSRFQHKMFRTQTVCRLHLD